MTGLFSQSCSFRITGRTQDIVSSCPNQNRYEELWGQIFNYKDRSGNKPVSMFISSFNDKGSKLTVLPSHSFSTQPPATNEALFVSWDPYICSLLIVRPCPELHPPFLLITNLMHFFYVFIYSFHLSTCFEHQVLIIRTSNCINTSSGMISLCK